MLNKYSEIAPSEESKFAPSEASVMAILNYSKAMEVKKLKKKKVLINLN